MTHRWLILLMLVQVAACHPSDQCTGIIEPDFDHTAVDQNLLLVVGSTAQQSFRTAASPYTDVSTLYASAVAIAGNANAVIALYESETTTPPPRAASPLAVELITLTSDPNTSIATLHFYDAATNSPFIVLEPNKTYWLTVTSQDANISLGVHGTPDYSGALFVRGTDGEAVAQDSNSRLALGLSGAYCGRRNMGSV